MRRTRRSLLSLSVLARLDNNPPTPSAVCLPHGSWSAAIQLPLLELCKGKKDLAAALPDMAALYVKELKMAADAATGEHEWSGDEGAHRGASAGGADD